MAVDSAYLSELSKQISRQELGLCIWCGSSPKKKNTTTDCYFWCACGKKQFKKDLNDLKARIKNEIREHEFEIKRLTRKLAKLLRGVSKK